MFRVLLILVCCAASTAARADLCPGNPDARGTEGVLAIDTALSARVGRKQFPDTLPLAPKEIVLTFDDGPWPSTTPAVLDALKDECVQATFFLLGRMRSTIRNSPAASGTKDIRLPITPSITPRLIACLWARQKLRSTGPLLQ
jgi:hypothetical protein